MPFVLLVEMRRLAVALILVLAMGCRYYEAGKHAAVSAVVTSIVRLQSHAPLTQSSARPATLSHGRRLIAHRCPLSAAGFRRTANS